MDKLKKEIIKFAQTDDTNSLLNLLNSGLNPNVGSGFPIQVSARYGAYGMASTLVLWGANPHMTTATGASPLQLAVFSGLHWDTKKWSFLLSAADSSQLADAAAVAVIFKNVQALMQIIDTGRCNLNIPTTLTGRTVEGLIQAYEMMDVIQSKRNDNALQVAEMSQINTSNHHLSPSVARFFQQTSRHLDQNQSPNIMNTVLRSPQNLNINSVTPPHRVRNPPPGFNASQSPLVFTNSTNILNFQN